MKTLKDIVDSQNRKDRISSYIPSIDRMKGIHGSNYSIVENDKAASLTREDIIKFREILNDEK